MYNDYFLNGQWKFPKTLTKIRSTVLLLKRELCPAIEDSRSPDVRFLLTCSEESSAQLSTAYHCKTRSTFRNGQCFWGMFRLNKDEILLVVKLDVVQGMSFWSKRKRYWRDQNSLGCWELQKNAGACFACSPWVEERGHSKVTAFDSKCWQPFIHHSHFIKFAPIDWYFFKTTYLVINHEVLQLCQNKHSHFCKSQYWFRSCIFRAL